MSLSPEGGIVFLCSAHQLSWVVSFHSLPVSWATLFIVFACPFCSPLQEACVAHFVVPLCCCSFSSLARIIVPLLISVISSRLSFLARIPLWRSERKTFRINLRRLRLLYGRGSALKRERKRSVACRRCCDMLCILSNSRLRDSTDESCDWSHFLKISKFLFLKCERISKLPFKI